MYNIPWVYCSIVVHQILLEMRKANLSSRGIHVIQIVGDIVSEEVGDGPA